MNADPNSFATIVRLIREAIGEDWVDTYEITAATRFNDDLEIDSVEFVRIVEAVQEGLGVRIDITRWLAGKTLPELIDLRVGDLAEMLDRASGA